MYNNKLMNELNTHYNYWCTYKKNNQDSQIEQTKLLYFEKF